MKQDIKAPPVYLSLDKTSTSINHHQQAIITFADGTFYNHDAQICLNALDGNTSFGAAIHVSEIPLVPKSNTDFKGLTKWIKISNLPSNIDTDHIIKHFTDFGIDSNVIDKVILRPLFDANDNQQDGGYALMKWSTVMDANNAVEKGHLTRISSRELWVEWSMDASFTEAIQRDRRENIWIGRTPIVHFYNLHWSVTGNDLKTLCATYGHVEECWVAPRVDDCSGKYSLGVGAVKMEYTYTALDVFEHLHGTILKGNEIGTSYSDRIFPKSIECPQQFRIGHPTKSLAEQRKESKMGVLKHATMRIDQINNIQDPKQRITELAKMVIWCERKRVDKFKAGIVKDDTWDAILAKRRTLLMKEKKFGSWNFRKKAGKFLKERQEEREGVMESKTKLALKRIGKQNIRMRFPNVGKRRALENMKKGGKPHRGRNKFQKRGRVTKRNVSKKHWPKDGRFK